MAPTKKTNNIEPKDPEATEASAEDDNEKGADAKQASKKASRKVGRILRRLRPQHQGQRRSCPLVDGGGLDERADRSGD